MRFPAAAVLAACAVAAAAWLTGPPGFDALDGCEFAVASQSLSICHPPSYPLFLMLLEVFPGAGYEGCRLFCCTAAGIAAAIAMILLRKLGSGPAASLAAVALLFSTPAIMAQLNCAEVHGLAMLLVLAGLLAQASPASPYLFSLSVFGGHPAAVLALPLFRPARWGAWALLAAVPAGLMLYVPLRAGASGVSHYTHPDGLRHLVSFMSLYSGRLSAPSAERLAGAFSSSLPSAALLLATAVAGRPRPREMVSSALALALIASYEIPDPEGLAWAAMLPLWLSSARGFDRLAGRCRAAMPLGLCAVAAVAWAGIPKASRHSDDIAPLMAADMMREAPPGAVYCTIGHDTFHAAYLIQLDDRRPDIIPVDLYGNYFGMRLQSPLPAAVADRAVVATRAWNDPGFSLSGLVFRTGGPEPDWGSLDTFAFDGRSPDPFAEDMAAEAWARRALQSSGYERVRCAAVALSRVSTATARRRVEQMLENS